MIMAGKSLYRFSLINYSFNAHIVETAAVLIPFFDRTTESFVKQPT